VKTSRATLRARGRNRVSSRSVGLLRFRGHTRDAADGFSGANTDLPEEPDEISLTLVQWDGQQGQAGRVRTVQLDVIDRDVSSSTLSRTIPDCSSSTSALTPNWSRTKEQPEHLAGLLECGGPVE
jgi:hypothetical protein